MGGTHQKTNQAHSELTNALENQRKHVEDRERVKDEGNTWKTRKTREKKRDAWKPKGTRGKRRGRVNNEGDAWATHEIDGKKKQRCRRSKKICSKKDAGSKRRKWEGKRLMDANELGKRREKRIKGNKAYLAVQEVNTCWVSRPQYRSRQARPARVSNRIRSA